jgi:hypothetical protein
LSWALPSSVIAYDNLFGDFTSIELGEVEHRAGSPPAVGSLDGNIDSSGAMWMIAHWPCSCTPY